MQGPHYRRIELQSPADFTYLYANTVALSRRKLDLHLPPSATNNDNDAPDPMRERVRELVDGFINHTFTAASASISINGLDSTSPQFPFPASITAQETVEYEPYDTELASRVTSLYAQLESLTTTVAQLRRDAPGRAAKEYAERLKRAIEEEDDEDDEVEDEGEEEPREDQDADDEGANEVEDDTPYAQEGGTIDKIGHGGDVDMLDAAAEESSKRHGNARWEKQRRRARRDGRRASNRSIRPDWKIQIPLGTEHEADRWHSGDVAELYEDTLRILLRLQGEQLAGDHPESAEGHALATTMGKVERAGRAVEVVEKV